MFRTLRAVTALLGLLAFSIASLAATPTCVVGVKGAAPTASITFTPPTAQADGAQLPTGTALTYNLYQGTSTGTEVKVASTTSGSPITVSTGITSSATYYWYVTAVDASGEGAPSNEVCKTFPASPPGTVTITIS
jgi:hypothetical protein